MAMVTCAECGASVSTSAWSCPRCGHSPAAQGCTCATCGSEDSEGYYCAFCDKSGNDPACPHYYYHDIMDD